ncbi:MAG: rod shape-determining protein MreD [Desulfitobacteriaceae bacterium]
MMRYFLIVMMLILSFILSGTVFHFWAWSGIKPDLVMLLIIYIALHHRLFAGAMWGLVAGILEDLYIGRFVGMYAFTLTLVALLSGWLAQRWYRDNFLLINLLVFVVSVVGQLLVAFLSLGAGLQWSLGDILQVSVGVAIYNAILVPATYPLIHRSFLYGWLRYQPKYERQ